MKRFRMSVVVALAAIALSAFTAGCGGSGGGGNSGGNTAPAANAGPDRNISTGSLVTLNGSGSTDADSDTFTYIWSFTSIPAGSAATLSSATLVNPTFTADKDGAYVLSLVVNDVKVNSTADSVTITAATGNRAPVANAGTDQNVLTGSLVTLDGSGSSDANGEGLTYSWLLTSVPALSGAALSSTTASNPTFTADVEGSYVVSLIVNDGTVDSAADTVIVTVTVAANAIKLPQTGQTTCYDGSGNVITCTNTGQDGALQKGVAWPSPRFAANGDTTITDNLTGLAWAPDGNLLPTRDSGWDADSTANDGAVTWQHALDYVAKLNAENFLGHNDWRLPNRKELKSLVNYGEANNATWLNTQGFTDAQASGYWSSTSYADYADIAWYVQMSNGYLGGGNKTDSSYTYSVWPVRAGQSAGAPAELPKTGQTICYESTGIVITCTNTGQDGELQKGVAWPSPRFAANGDTTITDNLTGFAWAPDGNLMSTRDNGWDADSTANDGAVTWQHALDYVAKLNAENYLGHSDWRLPDVNELESVVNSDQSNTATWLNTEGFSNAQADKYWSSTTCTFSASYAWFVGMFDGDVYYYGGKAGSHYVWPVRGGQ